MSINFNYTNSDNKIMIGLMLNFCIFMLIFSGCLIVVKGNSG